MQLRQTDDAERLLLLRGDSPVLIHSTMRVR